MVPFTRSFRGSDDEIPRTVLDASLADPGELSGVLNRALAALPGIRARGSLLQAPSLVEAAVEFRAVTDPFAVWLDRATVEDPQATVPKAGLLRAYNAVAQREGRPVATANEFGRALRRLRPHIRDAQRTVAGKLTWVWLGLRQVAPETG